MLVLYSDNRVLPGLAILDETLVTVLRADYGPQVELFNEFLGLDGSRPAGYEDDLVAFLRKKYAGTQIDAIVAVRSPALKFLLQRRDQFLPGVPVVHVSISTQELAGMELPRDVIGVPVKLQPEKTIELALRLHPGARRVVVITGTSGFDRAWEALLRVPSSRSRHASSSSSGSGCRWPRFSTGCERLPADSIVYLPGLQARTARASDSCRRRSRAEIVSVSPAPVYGNASNFREVGTMGGYIAPIEEIARQAGLLFSAPAPRREAGGARGARLGSQCLHPQHASAASIWFRRVRASSRRDP